MRRSIIFGLLLGVLFARQTYAATLFLRPAQKQVAAGNIFTIKVLVDTQSKTINNADAVIRFPSDVMDVVSIDTKSSIFSLWPENATFSNTAGTISFNGGIVNPGYVGSGGEVLSLVARAKKPGVGSFVFASAAVRENDGLGTDVLTGTTGSDITIVAATKTEEPKVEQPVRQVTGENPIAPLLEILSSTHPDQESWYADRDARLSWQKPDGSLGYQYVFGGPKGTIPSGKTQTTSSVQLNKIRDGVSFFHARYLTNQGWSPTTSFAVRVDTVAPTDLRVETVRSPEGQLALRLSANDALSGVDHFTVGSDELSSQTVPATQGIAEYILPVFAHLGTYDISVAAYDRAGNMTSTLAEVTVDSLPAPVITSVSEFVSLGKTISLAGTSPVSNAQILLTIKGPDQKVENYLLSVDSEKQFSFTSRSVDLEGSYEVWAVLMNAQGEKSHDSVHKTISVTATIFDTILAYAHQNTVLLVLAIFAFIGFIETLYLMYRRLTGRVV